MKQVKRKFTFVSLPTGRQASAVPVTSGQYPLFVFGSMIMTAVTAMMHKQMHEEAAKQKCERQIWQQMLAMISDEIDSGDHQKADQNVPGARARCTVSVIVHTLCYFSSKLELCIQTI
ncbi:MAG: hypothetical protein A3E38_00820 [Candidatus Moranbacteria bacterium RIFCSPHIGHO2_12_FULL_54_9]|nr:MAG: hypothetical protein A2878_03230 [Candidatus Moranbacteria bacterium RIFCSPHIGHO2_01_FULL_54_31]OGI26094.1 MAG: hypothetical protein A3E38_00820 [Candidatus Moranbacteria bacterium RIFCSPHIGHO2_12_FULL_54_9]